MLLLAFICSPHFLERNLLSSSMLIRSYFLRNQYKGSLSLSGGSSPVNVYSGAAGSFFVEDLVGKVGSQKRMTFDARDPDDPIKDTAPSIINMTRAYSALDEVTFLGKEKFLSA